MKVPFHESDRLLFIKKPNGLFGSLNRSIRTGLVSVLAFGFVCSVLVGYSHLLYQKGIRDGARQALDTRTPSEQLEMACAGLWVGKQNQKYFNKTY